MPGRIFELQITFLKESSMDGTVCLKMRSITRVSMDLKGFWIEDEKWRWTSSWTNSPPSPIGHIFSSELVWPHQVNYQVNMFEFGIVPYPSTFGQG